MLACDRVRGGVVGAQSLARVSGVGCKVYPKP